MLQFLVLVSCVLVCQGISKLASSDFNTEQKQRLLNLHNYYRAKVAQGKENDQPNAGNMLAATWDDWLSAKAQKWANECKAENDAAGHRQSEDYPDVGQNMADGAGMREAVKGWYDEVHENNFEFGPDHDCDGVCRHYTQIVWWNSWKIGCGQKVCSGTRHIFCNYAPAGNVMYSALRYESMYLDGPPCSKCPHGFDFCMNNALCATQEQCSSSMSKCKCTIDKCEQGELDSKECKCSESDLAKNPKMMAIQNGHSIKTNVLNLDKDVNCGNNATDKACEEQSDECENNVEWAEENCRRECKICDPGKATEYEASFSSGSTSGDRSYPVQFYHTFLTSLFLLIFPVFIF